MKLGRYSLSPLVTMSQRVEGGQTCSGRGARRASRPRAQPSSQAARTGWLAGWVAVLPAHLDCVVCQVVQLGMVARGPLRALLGGELVANLAKGAARHEASSKGPATRRAHGAAGAPGSAQATLTHSANTQKRSSSTSSRMWCRSGKGRLSITTSTASQLRRGGEGGGGRRAVADSAAAAAPPARPQRQLGHSPAPAASRPHLVTVCRWSDRMRRRSPLPSGWEWPQ